MHPGSDLIVDSGRVFAGIDSSLSIRAEVVEHAIGDSRHRKHLEHVQRLLRELCGRNDVVGIGIAGGLINRA